MIKRMIHWFKVRSRAADIRIATYKRKESEEHRKAWENKIRWKHYEEQKEADRVAKAVIKMMKEENIV